MKNSGDRKAYDLLLGQELTDLSNSNKPRVWRLLLKQDGYRKFGLKPRPFRTALSYNGKSDNQAKN
ncbi:hypothetical protein [Microcystis aeruginosa]|jgi:hypothetical protein|uniref:Uncharacterized protein n=2 Tax=Microcystis TaxID=1125 RepID=A0A552H785_MICVR|nr:hypothetical protein [Microcystis aeruginosa]TRU67098.1 MAG: hypothetical protein EWV77_23220 [Microcystis viridis Mv_BB_P_19951000_S68D]TRU77742.1 MAG: hypothetical protein EWV47_03400 [Microcystis viridis Mv_BB_P_19951000_S68]TRU79529.1 MAG: hypothetical protein EWV55_00270 [Microcystis viridis Mv_BB_P_19951000_S69]TRU80207.1 MAG: hypothetical protein EWV46_24010 [Microcystis viridis Mv_BB_P_19951000_S69D]MDB9421527.1 hypothetical protein [Microcystis aeruginosa CS-563/04]